MRLVHYEIPPLELAQRRRFLGEGLVRGDAHVEAAAHELVRNDRCARLLGAVEANHSERRAPAAELRLRVNWEQNVR